MRVPLGEIELELDFVASEQPTHPNLVLAHPHPLMGGSMDNKIILELYRRAKARGWGCVRFNFRGVGASSGKHDRGKGETQDLANLLDWLKSEHGWKLSQTILCGYSFGSWICAQVAISQERLGGLYLIAPPIKNAPFPNLTSLSFPRHVFAAAEDEIVPISELETWAQDNASPNGFHVFGGANHFFVGHTIKLVDSVIDSIEQLPQI